MERDGKWNKNRLHSTIEINFRKRKKSENETKNLKKNKVENGTKRVERQIKFALKKGQNSNISTLMQCEKKG